MFDSRYRARFSSRRALLGQMFSLVGLLCLAGIVPGAAQAQGKKGPFVLGAKPSPLSAFKRNSRFLIKAMPRAERPSSFLLTEYLPPIKSQGGQGSCVGWASAYYSYSYAVARQRKLSREQIESENWEFSPAFIYNQNNNGQDVGMYIYKAFEFLKEKGCCSLAEMPYTDQDYTTQPDETANSRAQKFIAFETASLVQGRGTFDPETVKTFLVEMKQPIALGIPIFSDFPGWPDGRKSPLPEDYVYDHTTGTGGGGHAITIIGYDDDKRAFRMVNSWGENWGDKGYCWLSEDFLKQYASDGWGMVVPGGGKARVGKARTLPLTPRIQIAFPPRS